MLPGLLLLLALGAPQLQNPRAGADSVLWSLRSPEGTCHAMSQERRGGLWTAPPGHRRPQTPRSAPSAYGDRVDFAFLSGELGADRKLLAEPTKDLFKKRRDVVHNHWNPTEDEAGQILGIAKKVVDHLKANLR